MKKIFRFEKRHKKADEFYRLLFYAAKTPTIVIEENAIITLANREFRKISGFSMEEIEYKKSIFDFINKDDLFKVKKYHELLRSRPDLVPNSYEVRAVDRSGNSKSLLVKVAMIPGTKKTVASFIDITDEKAAQEELLNTRQKLLSIIEFLPDATFVVDQDRRVITWNRAIEDMTGVRKEDMIGKGNYAYAVPFYGEPRPILIDHIFENEKSIKYQYAHHYRKEKDTIFAEEFAPSLYEGKGAYMWGKASPLLGIDGNIIGAVESIRDITQNHMDFTARMEMEAELALRNDFLEQILHTAGVVILVLDTNGRILRFNRFGEQLTGFLEKEIVGKFWLDTLISKKKHAKFAGIIKEIKEKGFATGEDFFLSMNNREILVKWNASVLKSSTNRKQTFLVVGHDVSELRTVEAQLLQAQKMEAIGRLAGGIAHDFNNILTGILGNVSSILTNISPDCEHFEALKEVKDAALMAADIVEKLLGFSRKSLMKSAVVDINDNIYEAYNIIKHTIDPRIAIKTSLDENLWLAAADKTRIIQILMNLCLNAQDAMAEGGTITIKTENITISEDCLKNQPSYVRPGDFIKVSVIDTGCGMPPEIQEQIFEPFFTTKKKGHGTGLGLSMVYGIVKQLKGWIDCSSELGGGTVFLIYLPRFSGEVTSAKQPAACTDVVDLSGTETILVVDDKKIVSNYMRRVLAKSGYKTLTAGDGHEAIEFYRKYWKEIDLVILDMTLPKISGRDVLIAMKEINPAAKVLLTSGYLFDDLKDQVLSGYEFLHKPFAENDLLRHLKKMLPTLQ